MKTTAKRVGTFIRSSTERKATERSNVKDMANIKLHNILRNELERAFPAIAILSEDEESVQQKMYEVEVGKGALCNGSLSCEFAASARKCEHYNE